MSKNDPAQEFYKKSKAGKVIKKEMDSFAMWSFFLSILPLFFGYILFFMFFSALTFLFSIFFGILSILRIKKDKSKYGLGFAITGIIISVLSLIILIFLYLSL